MTNVAKFPPQINRNRVSSISAAAIRHLESPAIKPLSHNLDCWRGQLLRAVCEMHAAGVDRSIIEAEVEATLGALESLRLLYA